MLRALDEFVIEGVVKTLIGFPQGAADASVLHRRGRNLSRPRRVGADGCAGCRASRTGVRPASRRPEVAAVREGCSLRRGSTVAVFEVRVLRPEPAFAGPGEAPPRTVAQPRDPRGAGRDAVVSPMQGTVLAVEVSEGDRGRGGPR